TAHPTMRAAGGTTPPPSASAIGRRAAPRSMPPRRSRPTPSFHPIHSATGIRAGRFAATNAAPASSARRREPRRRGLPAAAVEGRGVERRGVDVVEAAHVDRDHLIALRSGSARERAHAALRAEQVMDRFLAELVVLEILGAGAQREACRWHERPERAALL